MIKKCFLILLVSLITPTLAQIPLLSISYHPEYKWAYYLHVFQTTDTGGIKETSLRTPHSNYLAHTSTSLDSGLFNTLKNRFSNINEELCCYQIPDTTILFSKTLNRALLEEGIEKPWNNWESFGIVTDSSQVLNFTYPEWNTTITIPRIQKKLPDIKPGERVLVIPIADGDNCMCGGFCVYFGKDNYSHTNGTYPLWSEQRKDELGVYGLATHKFTEKDSGYIGFSLYGAAHAMHAKLYGVIILKIDDCSVNSLKTLVKKFPVKQNTQHAIFNKPDIYNVNVLGRKISGKSESAGIIIRKNPNKHFQRNVNLPGK